MHTHTHAHAHAHAHAHTHTHTHTESGKLHCFLLTYSRHCHVGTTFLPTATTCCCAPPLIPVQLRDIERVEQFVSRAEESEKGGRLNGALSQIVRACYTLYILFSFFHTCMDTHLVGLRRPHWSHTGPSAGHCPQQPRAAASQGTHPHQTQPHRRGSQDCIVSWSLLALRVEHGVCYVCLSSLLPPLCLSSPPLRFFVPFPTSPTHACP